MLAGVLVEPGAIELAVIVEGVDPPVELVVGATEVAVGKDCGVIPRDDMQAIKFWISVTWEAVAVGSLAD